MFDICIRFFQIFWSNSKSPQSSDVKLSKIEPKVVFFIVGDLSLYIEGKSKTWKSLNQKEKVR